MQLEQMKFILILVALVLVGLQGCAQREAAPHSPAAPSMSPGFSNTTAAPPALEEAAPLRPPAREDAPPSPNVVRSPEPSTPVAAQQRGPARPVRSAGSMVAAPTVPATSWIRQVLLLVPGVEHQRLSDREAAFFRVEDAKERRVPLFEQAIVLANTRAALAGMREIDRPHVLMERGRLRLIFPSDAAPENIARAVARSLKVAEVSRVYVTLGR